MKRRRKRVSLWNEIALIALALACLWVIRQFRHLSDASILIFLALASLFFGLSVRRYPLGSGRFEREVGCLVAVLGFGLLILVVGWLLGLWPISILER